jgi:hypothetical protein
MGRYVKKKKPANGNFAIVRDDREKKPWKLWKPVIVKRLSVGDYSIVGYEDVIAIEKKSGLVELLNDLTAGYRSTFERFLKCLSEYPVKCMVVDEQLSEWRVHKALKIVKEKSRGKSQLIPRTIYYWVSRITNEYNIPILFLDARTRDLILPEIFKTSYEKASMLK